MKTFINSIVRQLRDIQHERNWVGSSFDWKLKSITDAQAFIRPLPDLHSVAEIISHLTAWRNDAMLKLETGRGKLKEEDEENWPTNDKLSKLGWERIRSDYDRSLDKLIGLLESKDDDFLSEKYYDQDFKGEREYRFVVEGLLHHDIYHLGQLGIVIKFLNIAIR